MAPPPPIDDGTSVTMTATSAREVAAGRGLYRLDGWALREQAGHAAAEQPDSLPFKDPFEGFKLTDSIVSGLFATVCLGTVAIAYWKTKRSYVKELDAVQGEVLEADIMEGKRLAARGLVIATALTTGSFSAMIFGVSRWMEVDNIKDFSSKAQGSLRGVSSSIEGWFKDINTLPSARAEEQEQPVPAPLPQIGNGSLRGINVGTIGASANNNNRDHNGGSSGGGSSGGEAKKKQKKEKGGLQWWAEYFDKKKKAKEEGKDKEEGGSSSPTIAEEKD